MKEGRHDKLFKKIKDGEEFRLEELRIYILEDILSLMESERIDQAELARRLNTSRAYVTKLFNTNINLTLLTLNKIAKALGAKVSVRFSTESKPADRSRAISALAGKERDRARRRL